MVGCPFGFHANDGSDIEDLDTSPRKPKEQPSKCPFASQESNDDRFDYNKDPVSWFYQNQIRSEEEFKAKKAELRAAAQERLETIFEKKGKHLIIDSDDDFSINTSELSAWDSDVHSIQTLASCANSWAEAADFQAPALTTLHILLIVTFATAMYSGWQSLQALTQIKQFWGIVKVGWVPGASLGAAVVAAIIAALFWHMTACRSKPGLLSTQVAVQIACAGYMLLAVLCWVHPTYIDPQFRSKLCNQQGPQPSESTSRLCSYLPMVQEQIDISISTLLSTNAGLAILALAVTCAGSWAFWELNYVEKKASKHKRRRKHRKNSIPWEKIKVEEMGPVSYCGTAPPVARKSAAAAASAAGVAAATTSHVAKKEV